MANFDLGLKLPNNARLFEPHEKCESLLISVMKTGIKQRSL